MTRDDKPLSQISQAVMALLQLVETGRQTGEDLFSLHLEWDTRRNRWQVSAITAQTEETDAIDAVRAWANAMGGTVHLSEVRTFQTVSGGIQPYRRLAGRGEVAGIPVEIHEHLYDLEPAAANLTDAA